MEPRVADMVRDSKHTTLDPAVSNGSFAVASYNIHRCIGVDKRYDPERIIQVMHELQVDIIGLQEVDCQYFLKDGTDQVDLFKDATGFHAIDGVTLQREDGRFGNLLLTRWPVLKVRRIDLSFPRRVSRGAIDVDLNIKGQPVRLIVAHLGLSGAERRYQIKRLREAVTGNHNGGVEVMFGDFNEWFPKSRSLSSLHQYFGKPPTFRTFPSRFPVLALDRIWVRPYDALIHLQPHISPLSRIASDHLPLKGDIALTC